MIFFCNIFLLDKRSFLHSPLSYEEDPDGEREIPRAYDKSSQGWHRDR